MDPDSYDFCPHCTDYYAQVERDMSDYRTLQDLIEKRRSLMRNRKTDECPDTDTHVPKIPDVGTSTGGCSWCENSRICSQYFRLYVNPLLLKVLGWLEQGPYHMKALRMNEGLINEQPHLNPKNHDIQQCEVLCNITAHHANRIARVVLDDLETWKRSTEASASPPRGEESMNETTNQNPSESDLSTTGDSSKFADAQKFVYESADHLMDEIEGNDGPGDMQRLLETAWDTDWNNMTFKGIHGNTIVHEYRIETAKGYLCVLDCISLIVAEYMSVNNGAKPDDNVVQNIFEVLNADDDKRAAFILKLPNLIKSTTSALQFISMMETVSDEASGEGKDARRRALEDVPDRGSEQGDEREDVQEKQMHAC
jgi:hypothetical protein